MMLNVLSSDSLPQRRWTRSSSFPCSSFSHSSQEMLFFFFPIGTFTLYQPSFCMWVLLVLTNKVRLSLKCILAISISCAASHWSCGSLSQCKRV